jgi:hypothetical protein
MGLMNMPKYPMEKMIHACEYHQNEFPTFLDLLLNFLSSSFSSVGSSPVAEGIILAVQTIVAYHQNIAKVSRVFLCIYIIFNRIHIFASY